MLDTSKSETDQTSLVCSKKQIVNENAKVYIDEQLSADEVEELVNNLTITELFEESAEKLIYHFSNYPYIYDKIYIEVLFNYFLEEYELPDDIITLIGEILNSLFRYNDQNYLVLEVMKNEEFYSLIWPFIDRIPSIMTLYKWLIKTFPCVFDFVMKNDICEKLSMIIFPEGESTPILFDLISSFSYYKDHYDKFTHLINSVCEMTFCTINMDIFKAGIHCISEFTQRSVDFALGICKNPSFFEFCTELDQGRFLTFESIVDLIYKTLQNREIYFKMQTVKSSITALLSLLSDGDTDATEQFKQCIYSIVNTAVVIIEDIQSQNCDESFLMPAVKALSMLIYGPEMAKYYIDSDIHSLLFDIAANDNVTFLIHVEAFRALCRLISSSYFSETKVLIDMDFLSVFEDQIEMMVKLPNTTIDALTKIVDFSEGCEEAKDWGNMIFENETIISQLQFIADNPEKIDEDNYAQDFVHNASILLQRRPVE